MIGGAETWPAITAAARHKVEADYDIARLTKELETIYEQAGRSHKSRTHRFKGRARHWWQSEVMKPLQSRNSIRRINTLNPPPTDSVAGELRLFMKVRNEALRLPFVLDYYYRERGVEQAFIIDNGSTDDTIDILAERLWVHVFQTQESYVHHWTWMKHIVNRFGDNHWCIIVDADEMLVYPYWESLSIPTFAGPWMTRGHYTRCWRIRRMRDGLAKRPVFEPRIYRTGT